MNSTSNSPNAAPDQYGISWLIKASRPVPLPHAGSARRNRWLPTTRPKEGRETGASSWWLTARLSAHRPPIGSHLRSKTDPTPHPPAHHRPRGSAHPSRVRLHIPSIERYAFALPWGGHRMQNRGRRTCNALTGLLAALGFFAANSARAQQVPANLYSGMKWRMIGPFRAGKVNAVAGVPGNSSVYYFGSNGGGVWKTTDGGVTWRPIFDDQPVAPIGALTLAPSNSNIIYVGTGVNSVYSDIAHGNGVYKSTDAGNTWQHLGLDDTRHIGRILVDPRNPDIVLVAAMGHSAGPNEERGVFRSADGGRTWKKVLYHDDVTGAIGDGREFLWRPETEGGASTPSSKQKRSRAGYTAPMMPARVGSGPQATRASMVTGT